jgi:sarcosine oxidase, subunit alpha
MPRLHEPSDPVTLQFDGEAVVAQRGEPAAVALIAAGHLALARSPKFHRPRGPWCLRAACDGCLARVDGVPNVMLCRAPAAEGMRIETQNVLGVGGADVLRAADWFFPEGLNHHEFLAGVPGLQRVLQVLARRIAGLGKLPDHQRANDLRAAVSPPWGAGRRRNADVLVVGSGPAGMAAALSLQKRRRSVEVIEDDLVWGGSARALAVLPATNQSAWQRLSSAFGEAVAASRISIRLRTTAAGVYGDDIVLATEGAGAEVVTARTLVLAPGAHDGLIAFEGNDLPGVMSARAAGYLLSHGVTPGDQVAIAVAEGGGPFGEGYSRASRLAALVRGAPLRAKGSTHVREVTVAGRRGERRLVCDSLLVDAPRSPAYELCAQAGAELSHDARGFAVQATGGRIRDGVFAVGEVVGSPLEPEAILRQTASLR